MKVDRIIRTALIILIGISLFLSWSIWTSPNKYDRDATVDRKQTSFAVEKKLTDVFLPTSFIYHLDNEARYSNNESLIHTIMRELGTWEYDYIVYHGEILSEEDFKNKVSSNNHVEISYPDEVTFSVFRDTYGTKFGQYGSDTFNRIVFDLNQPHTVYFFNDETKAMYSSKVSREDVATIKKAIASEQENFEKVAPYFLANHYDYLQTQEISLPRYSYLIEEQSIPQFIELLFPDPLAVKHDVVDNYDQYEDGKSVLKVWPKRGILVFFNPSEQKISAKQRNITEDLVNSFSIFNRLGGWVGSMRYFEYNPGENQVIYRRYIDGFPVFSEDRAGSMLITLGDTGLRKLQRVIFNIQVPIPSDKANKILPSGVEILGRLNRLGYAKDTIQGLEVGYHWEKNIASSQQVIDMEPTWYVLIDKGDGLNWYTVDHLEEEGAKNGF